MEDIKYPHLAVIGRIAGDDEDNVKLYTNLTSKEATDAFKEDSKEEDADDYAAACQKYGEDDSIYITHILVSQTPISTR
jgi:hypothetical protein